MSGSFITFEGIDGCGKSTQLELLKQNLLARDVPILVTREPGGTSIGKGIREVLLAKQNQDLSTECELLLLMADRTQHISEVLRPALANGIVVLCDRYSDSTIAFQAYGRGVDLSRIHELNSTVTGGLQPDLTLLFDIDPLIARARLESRQRETTVEMSRFDDEALVFHNRVRAGYLELASAAPERFRVIDAAGPVCEIQEFVLSMVTNFLGIRI